MYPFSASTTKPVASLATAGSVSKEQVWQKCMETTFLMTFWTVFCHSAVSAVAGTLVIVLPSSMSKGISTPFAGSLPFVYSEESDLICFIGRSFEGVGGCLRLLLESPLLVIMVDDSAAEVET